jgi:hypothetical protein
VGCLPNDISIAIVEQGRKEKVRKGIFNVFLKVDPVTFKFIPVKYLFIKVIKRNITKM